jgi:pyruvate kinase
MGTYTKIIATIGPASCRPDVLQALRKAGMNAARINLSHGDRGSQAEYIKAIRGLDINFPIILDTKGPEIRTGEMPEGAVRVAYNSEWRLKHSSVQRPPSVIMVDYPHLHDIDVNTHILFDDGLVESKVIANRNGELTVRMMNDGTIGAGKKVTIQGHHVKLPFLTERDQQDIQFAIKQGIGLLAASFVRSAQDLQSLKDYLAANGSHMKIIAKIEHRDAIANLADIIELSDGIMVARGDLGVELPLEEVPGIQADIIKQCNQAGKPVIVATQMLESMRENLRPTRAEVNDIAHAILQGADAVMLSAETATGHYPVRSVEMMNLIARQYENQVKGIITKYRRQDERGQIKIAQFIAKAAFYASDEVGAAAIITPTETGFTARNVSRFKPKCPILATTKDPVVLQLLHLVWGVNPLLDTENCLDMSHYDMSYHLIHHHCESGVLSAKDRIIITSGSNLLTKRGTNLLEIYTVEDIIQEYA